MDFGNKQSNQLATGWKSHKVVEIAMNKWETVPRRAWKDTEHFRQTNQFWYWGVEVLGGGLLSGTLGGLLGYYWTPTNATPFLQNAYPIMGGGIGVVLGFFVVFLLIYW